MADNPSASDGATTELEKRRAAKRAAALAKLKPQPTTVARVAPVTIDHAAVDRGMMIEDRPLRVLPPPPARRKTGWINLLAFLLMVVAPSTVAGWYYGFVASDQYVSEARFAVRSLGDQNSSGSSESSGAIGKFGGALELDQDAYIVTSFIHSTELVRRLNERVNLRSYFNAPSIDDYSRLKPDVSAEQFLKYFSRQVSTYVDGPSGIITLYVRTFDPENSKTLADMITQESENLVNQLSERAMADVLKKAQEEVQQTETSYRKTLVDINEYQNRSGILDPALRATETGTLIVTLMAQKLDVESRLFVLMKSGSSSAPSVQQLQRTQAGLQAKIDDLRSQLASSGTADENLSKALKKFSELETDRLLTSSLYEAARKSLAAAQAEMIRKSVYLTVFVPPEVPGSSTFPHRASTIILIAAGLAIAWAICMLIWASVEDHRL